jgi:hypothetical protein
LDNRTFLGNPHPTVFRRGNRLTKAAPSSAGWEWLPHHQVNPETEPVQTMLAPATTVRLHHHQLKGHVDSLLGVGGQGEVYKLTLQAGDVRQELALKWYFPPWATPTQQRALGQLVEEGPPDARFLWPTDLATAAGRRGFGYTMPLRPASYASCTDIMSGRCQLSFRTTLTACLQLSDCLLGLHARGLCYRDISFGNVFVQPTTGHILIADNDNVAIDGEAVPGIRGTGPFMAPEVIRGTAQPSAATDRYSLAVLLFYLLVMHHPLEGKRLDGLGILGQAEAEELFGTHPVFIFDPADPSNAPERDSNAMVLWPLFPRPLQDLFTEAFTVGLHHPQLRVRESQWRNCMAQLLDLITVCRCGADVFVQLNGQPTAACWSCGATGETESRPPRLMLDLNDRLVVMLHVGKELFGHHLAGRSFDYRIPLARAEHDPQVGWPLVLRNLGTDAWVADYADGEHVTVPPRRAIRIEAGTRIRFGSVTGIVED